MEAPFEGAKLVLGLEYCQIVNVGKVVLGVSTALAVVAAIAFGVETLPGNDSPPPDPITGPRINVCGSPATSTGVGPRTMAGSFVIKNTSSSPVTIRALSPTSLIGLASARVTMANGADPADVLHYRVGATVGVPADEISKSSPIAPDRPTTLAPNAFATVVTTLTLAHGAQAGSAANFKVTTENASGALTSQTIDASIGFGIDSSACSTLEG